MNTIKRELVDAEVKNEPPEDPESSKPTCDICKKVFNWTSNLQRHVRTVHARERNHGCLECGKSFSCNGHLRKHVKAVHERVKDHFCEQCPYSASSAVQVSVYGCDFIIENFHNIEQVMPLV